jgi:hypothetical protein
MEQQGDVEMSEGPPGMLSFEGTASLPRPCLLGPEPSQRAVVTGALVVTPRSIPQDPQRRSEARGPLPRGSYISLKMIGSATGPTPFAGFPHWGGFAWLGDFVVEYASGSQIGSFWGWSSHQTPWSDSGPRPSFSHSVDRVGFFCFMKLGGKLEPSEGKEVFWKIPVSNFSKELKFSLNWGKKVNKYYLKN